MGGVAGVDRGFPLVGGRALRGIALIMGASLVCLAAPGLARAATVIDLGVGGMNGGDVAVNSQLEVLLPYNGTNGAVWMHGQLVRPMAPASDPTATFHPISTETASSEQSLNDSGVVVGNVKTGSGNTVPGYWDSAHSATFTEVSMSGVTVNGTAVTSGRFYAIDANGDAVGQVFGGSGGALYVPGLAGVPSGAPQAFSSIGGTPIELLDGIGPGYERGLNLSEDAILIDRTTQTATQTDLNWGASAFADNGTLTGPVVQSSGAPICCALRLAGGAETPFGSATSAVAGVNDAGEAVGTIAGVGTLWGAGGTSVPLVSLFPAGSGWSNPLPLAIDDQGDIVGFGTLNGHLEDFVLTGKANSSALLACRQTPAGTFSCTATVSATAGGGVAPTGEVDWSVSAGALSSSSCTLAAISVSASVCSVVLTPTQADNEKEQTVNADYTGANNFQSSTGTATIPPVMLTATPPATVDTYLDGSADAKFKLTLSRASNTPVTIDYKTKDGTGAHAAKAAEGDYRPVKGHLTIAPGKTTATVKVKCNADIKLRHTSDFDLYLSNLTGASLTSATATPTAAHARAHIPSPNPPGTLTVQANIKPDLRVGRVHAIRNVRTGKEGVLYVERYDTHKIKRLKEGDWIYVGDRVGATQSTATVISFELGGAVAVQPGHLIRIVDFNRSVTEIPSPNDQGILYELRQRFQVWCDVSHQKETMQVQTNGGVTSIKG
jgi:Calx-beta domain